MAVESSKAGDGLEEEYEAGIFWNEVVEVIFGVVSGGWYWVGELEHGVFMIVFHRMTCML